jgi:hypothetical protein
MITAGDVPSFERGLRYGVKWRPEPPGDEHFDSADRVLRRKAGDCDDLAPWHAASLRASGEDPGATAVVQRSGPARWHAVVQRSDGTIDDPSLRAGMGPGVAPMSHAVMGIVGATVPMMLPAQSVVGGSYVIRPQIAMRPVYGQIQARADIPWHWREHMALDKPKGEQIAVTALHTAPVAAAALVGAIDDAVCIAQAAGCGSVEHIDRLCALSDAIEGADFEELAEVYGLEHARAAQAVVGSFFGKIAKGLGRVAKGAVSFVPGVGPIASTALDAGGALMRGRQHHPSASPSAQPAAPHPYPARPAAAPAQRPMTVQRVPAQQGQPGLAAIDTGGARQIILNFH